VSVFEPPQARRHEARRRRRRRLVLAALGLVTAAALFGIGVAVGEALHDNPKPGGTRTHTDTIVLSGVSK
jgi:anti-sigma factor RsiW